MTVEQMAEPETTVFVARNEKGEAVGCGALKVHGGGLAEVKRMFTDPKVRGQGVGRQILDAIVALADQLGVTDLKLETGATEGFEPAWRLYERGGFTPCAAFLDYPDSGYSRFYERSLLRAEAAQ
jgi:putative acetyltransferase